MTLGVWEFASHTTSKSACYNQPNLEDIVHMPQPLLHDLYVPGSRETQARQDFVSSLRGFVLNDLATGMRTVFDEEIEPSALVSRPMMVVP